MAYVHLTGDERFNLEKRVARDDKVDDMAIVLGRHISALYRELNRNTDKSFGFYSGLRANNIAHGRNKSAKHKVRFFGNEDNKEGYDSRNCSNEEIRKLQNILNTRPRKKFGFMAPTQKMLPVLQVVA